jgi:DUF4097 and DUF4098 domain-containing protein YvlB
MKPYTIAVALIVGLMATPGLARDEFRESVSVEPGGTLEIDLAAGSVEVETHDDPEVQVNARARGWGRRSMVFELTSDGADARLVGKLRGWLGPFFGGPRVRVRVRVPEQYSVDVRTGGGSIEIVELGGEVRARTSGGSIELDGAEGSIELRTSGGEIKAYEIIGELSARTSGGEIEVSEVTGPVEARTSGGEIELHEVGGPVRAWTSGGSISVRFTRVPEGEIETSGGSIEVELPEGAGVDLDARTSGGRVRVEPELKLTGSFDRGRIVGQINGGGAELRLRTSGGNISVEER